MKLPATHTGRTDCYLSEAKFEVGQSCKQEIGSTVTTKRTEIEDHDRNIAVIQSREHN